MTCCWPGRPCLEFNLLIWLSISFAVVVACVGPICGHVGQCCDLEMKPYQLVYIELLDGSVPEKKFGVHDALVVFSSELDVDCVCQ